jgi:hypothetical protein
MVLSFENSVLVSFTEFIISFSGPEIFDRDPLLVPESSKIISIKI